MIIEQRDAYKSKESKKFVLTDAECDEKLEAEARSSGPQAVGNALCIFSKLPCTKSSGTQSQFSIARLLRQTWS